MQLPVGIRQDIGDVSVTIAIAEARLMATHAEVDILVEIDFPDTHEDPIFVARGVGWSRSGGFSGNIDLDLVADWGINIAKDKSRLILRKTMGSREGTYVTINCGGFVGGRIEASLVLSRDWVVPVRDNEILRTPPGYDLRTYNPDDRVHADFVIDVSREGGWLFETQINDPFIFKDKEQVEITVGQVAIDFSDELNPTEFDVPQNYRSPHVTDTEVYTTWRGMYLRGLQVRIPKEYRKDSSEALTIQAPYLIIDRTGVTTHLKAQGVLPLGEKTADKWAFSVDSFELKLTQNTFEAAHLSGVIGVPMLAAAAQDCGSRVSLTRGPGRLRREDCLAYHAGMSTAGFNFSVRTTTSYCAGVWGADVVVEPNSRVDLESYPGGLRASALLNASLVINAEVSDKVQFTMDSLSVDSLILRNYGQKFTAGTWGFPRNITARLSTFEVGFRNITLVTDSLQTGSNGSVDPSSVMALRFAAFLTVDRDRQFQFASEGVFNLKGHLQETEKGEERWAFRDFGVEAFYIEASTPAFEVEATLAWYKNDVEWGTGFYGSGRLLINDLNIEVAAVAQFGTKNNDLSVDERYWFVDVMTRFGTGIPIIPEALDLKAIGGGVYRNMSRATPLQQALASPNDSQITLAQSSVATAAATQSPLTGLLGVSTSGIEYKVDFENRFGAFLQLVVAGAQNEEAFSVNARLELEVRDTSGWSIALDGNITISGPVNYDNDPLKTEGVGIFVRMAYIKSPSYEGFRAAADVYVNVDEGTIKGQSSAPKKNNDEGKRRLYVANSLGYAGNISLEFSDQQWYIHVGYPPTQTDDRRIGLAITVPILGQATLKGYFCIGENIPPIPPLPRNVSRLTGDMDMSRDFGQYETASGFAFGGYIGLRSVDELVITYWDLTAEFSFDINLRNYGEATCSGRDGGVGIDGWYAAGQSAVYLAGEIGVKTPKFLGNRRVPVVDMELAAVLQLKGPNPIYARGVVAGRFRVLRVFRGSFRAEAEFGDRCILRGPDGGDPFSEMDLVISMSPDSAATDVSPSASVSAALILPLDEATDMGDYHYQSHLVRATLTEVGNNQPVTGTLAADSSSYSVTFEPDDFLKGATEYEFEIAVELDRREPDATRFGGPPVKTETKRVRFITGPDLLCIPESNVRYSYPLDGQANFHVDEFPVSFMRIERVQPNLMEDVTAVYLAANGVRTVADVTFNPSDETYRWETPDLSTNEVYELSLVQHYQPPVTTSRGGDQPDGTVRPGQPDGSSPSMPNGDSSGELRTGFGAGGGGPNGDYFLYPTDEVVNASAPPDAANKVLLVRYFRTSRYPTLEEKLDYVFADTDLSRIQGTLGTRFDELESFDTFDIRGQQLGDQPLIELEVLPTETYGTQPTINTIYDNIPVNGAQMMYNGDGWDELISDRPYNEVNLTAGAARISERDHVDNGNTERRNGGSLLLGYPVKLRSLMDSILHQATQTIYGTALGARRAVAKQNSNGETLVVETEGSANDGEGGASNTTEMTEEDYDMLLYQNCFPQAVSADSETAVTEDLVLDDLSPVPAGCIIPRELIELYRLSRRGGSPNYRNTSYPIRFRYVMPDGTAVSEITKTFRYE